MRARTHLIEYDIISGNFDKDKKYFASSLHFSKDYDIFSLDIDIIIKSSLTIYYLRKLSHISEKVIVQGSYKIQNCPLLKTFNFRKGSNIEFYNDQHLTTILSEEQFLSTRSLWVNYEIVTSYKEYYSLIEPILQKNNLMRICL